MRLETLKEAQSQQNSPLFMLESQAKRNPDEGRATTPELDPKEKRLPTLPNSPSSVLDAELLAMDTANQTALDLDAALRSHFSESTIAESVISPAFPPPQEGSHFSEYSIDTDMPSPSSMTSSSTFNYDKQSPPSLSVNADQSGLLKSPINIPSGPVTPTLSTIPESFSPSKVAIDYLDLHGVDASTSVSAPPADLSISGLCIDTLDDSEGQTKRQAAVFGNLGPWDGYMLPPHDSTSPPDAAFPEYHTTFLETPRAAGTAADGSEGREPGSACLNGDIHKSNAHLTTMQELMDELSYLGDMIQAQGTERYT
jgi:hypothetical protein